MATTKKTPAKRRAKLTKPAPLRGGHILVGFDCGEEELNRFLKKRALPAQTARTSNTFVVCRGRRVAGYYSLATGSVSHTDCTSSLRRNTPDPVPCIILGRLAVNKSEQNKKIGFYLVQDAMRRTLQAARYVAARTLVVHALDNDVVAFYKKLGFLKLPCKEGLIVLHLKLETIAASLGAKPKVKARK